LEYVCINEEVKKQKKQKKQKSEMRKSISSERRLILDMPSLPLTEWERE
jgi:hypothetical protein